MSQTHSRLNHSGRGNNPCDRRLCLPAFSHFPKMFSALYQKQTSSFATGLGSFPQILLLIGELTLYQTTKQT